MSWRARDLGARVTAGGATVTLPAVVLWVRQTREALLGVDSFGGALAMALLLSLPTVGGCMLLPRRRPTILIGGLGAAAALSAVWWGSARDWHSTASWRPALVGWFMLPIALLVLRFAEGRFNRGRASSVARGPG